MTNKTIRVELDKSKFWTLATHGMPDTKVGNQLLVNIAVLKACRDAGIPVEGGLEFRGVEHGRLTMFNEAINGKPYAIYEWAPGPDSPKGGTPAKANPRIDDDEGL